MQLIYIYVQNDNNYYTCNYTLIQCNYVQDYAIGN